MTTKFSPPSMPQNMPQKAMVKGPLEKGKKENALSSAVAAPPKAVRKILYGVVFYESFAAAKAAKDELLSLCQSCEQLNVVIRAEGDMDDADLLSIHPHIKVFAGAAWSLIHERRKEEGWYDQPQER